MRKQIWYVRYCLHTHLLEHINYIIWMYYVFFVLQTWIVIWSPGQNRSLCVCFLNPFLAFIIKTGANFYLYIFRISSTASLKIKTIKSMSAAATSRLEKLVQLFSEGRLKGRVWVTSPFLQISHKDGHTGRPLLGLGISRITDNRRQTSGGQGGV